MDTELFKSNQGIVDRCWQYWFLFVGLHLVINSHKLQTVVLDQVLKTGAELTPRASLAALNASRYFHVIQFSPF